MSILISGFKGELERHQQAKIANQFNCWGEFFSHPVYFLEKNATKKQCPTGRVFQYRVGSGRVLEKIPGSGPGSGRVGMLKNTIGYFRVSLLLSGNSGYSGYFRVFRVIHE